MNRLARLAGRVVIYGGSFDPPHMGHQMACLALLESLGAQAVWLVPVFTHPFGKQLTDFAHRFAMCERLAQPFGGRVQVSAAERELGGLGRTFDLVTALQTQHPDERFALAVGADIVAETERWHRWTDLVAMAPVVVLGRSGYHTSGAHTPDLPPIASSALRGMLKAHEDVTAHMPLSVAGYVFAHGLYGSTEPV